MDNAVTLDSVDDALAAIAQGGAVVVIDDEERENEGDLIFAAEKATPELVAFMVRHTSGYICVALEQSDADRLNLQPMVARNEDPRQTAYSITVDAATGTTGISARSRCETITRLADPSRTAEDFTRPGHVVPLRARSGGVLARQGHTEAAVDLARLAGLRSAGVLCEIVSTVDPTDMARGTELREFANSHDLPMISIAQLIEYRRRHDRFVTRCAKVQLPTELGTFTAYGYRNEIDGVEHIALVVGDVEKRSDVQVRVHSECLTGDVFGSRRCDCGEQLHESMRRVQETGCGVIVYLRGQEGRGIGLMAKLQAYELQEAGLDTVDANLQQGLPIDAREYSVAAQILTDLKVGSIDLLSNNPDKVSALEGYGIHVSHRTRIEVVPSHDNIRYLRTKHDRLGHDLPLAEHWSDEDADRKEK